MARTGRPPKIITPETKDLVARCLARQMPQFMIRHKVTRYLKLSKPINYRTFARLLSSASDLLFERMGKSKKTLRDELKAYFLAVLSDPKVKTVDQLRAAAEMVKMLRLAERIMITGPAGGPIKTESKTTVEVLANRVEEFPFDELRAALAARKPAEDGPCPGSN